MDGVERHYVVVTPAQAPVGVVVALHPGFATAEGFAQSTELTDAAAPARFIVVYPQGHGRSWNAGDCCGPAAARGVDDVAFAAAVLDQLASEQGLDDRSAFVTGFSNGAMMAYRLACELSDRVAAIAPVGGVIALSDRDCRPAHPVSVLHVHGTADRHAPFEGGVGARSQAGEQRSVPETIALWVRLTGAHAEPRAIPTRGPVGCDRHPEGRQDTHVTLCTVEGLGHQWPGATPYAPEIYGPGTEEVDASEMISAYFETQSELRQD